MIYVDSNIPMYLTGSDHPHRPRVIELMAQLVRARERLITSAETFQEVVHRYLSLRDRIHLAAAYEALEATVSSVVDVTKLDVDAARSMSGTYTGLSSRDCLHLAVMRRVDCSTIWTFDRGFSQVPWVLRVE